MILFLEPTYIQHVNNYHSPHFSLPQYVEQGDSVRPFREAYDAFLKRYPYCYGYWKKYADMERRHENMAMTEKVRGMRLICVGFGFFLVVDLCSRLIVEIPLVLNTRTHASFPDGWFLSLS